MTVAEKNIIDTLEKKLMASLCQHAPHILAGEKTLWLACSGGLDSSVLCHALSMLSATHPINLAVIHINHQWHPHAAQWAKQVKQQVKSYGITCHIKTIDQATNACETAARTARYQLINEMLHTGDVVMTAHHLDDQVETILMRLFRGTGPDGLGGIAPCSTLNHALLVRPLLAYTKSMLADYAKHHGLQWIDDPSNTALDADRNYLRHELIPIIEKRWPNYSKNIGKTAILCQQAKNKNAETKSEAKPQDQTNRLPLTTLHSFSKEKRLTLLRHWLIEQTRAYPTHAILDNMDRTLIQSRPDAQPEVIWQKWSIRRYRNRLYIHNKPNIKAIELSQQPMVWQLDRAINWQGGTLTATRKKGKGLIHLPKDAQLTLNQRPKGGSIQLFGHVHHKSIKKQLYDWSIPPWKRSTLAYLFHKNCLVAIAQYGIAECIATKNAEDWGWQISWHKPKHDALQI
jgi:tRNA(Ile)-lysidine synthase